MTNNFNEKLEHFCLNADTKEVNDLLNRFEEQVKSNEKLIVAINELVENYKKKEKKDG